MTRTKRVWQRHGFRRTKVALGAPFFEADAAPRDPAYRALRPEEEAESLARWKAEQLRQTNRVGPTTGELSTVAMFAAALLALMRMERVPLLDGPGQNSERLAGVEGGSRADQSVAPLYAELSGEDGGTSLSPATPRSNLADAAAGATILGPFHNLPDAAGVSGPLMEDRLDGMPVRPGTPGYLAGTPAPDAVPVTSAVSRPVLSGEAQLATALPIETGAEGALSDAPSTTERARQGEAERLGAIASSGETAAPQPATPESVWTELTWHWQPTAPLSPVAQPDQARRTTPAPMEGPDNSLPEPSQASERLEGSAIPPVLATGLGPQMPQDSPGNSENAPGLADALPPRLAKQEDRFGNREGPPVLADLLPPDLGKHEDGPSNIENAPGQAQRTASGSEAQVDGFLVALPPDLAKRHEADDKAQDDGLLAALPPGIAKRQETDKDDGGLLAALPPSLAKRQDADDAREDGLFAALPSGLAKRQEADDDGQHGGLLAALPRGLAKRQEADDDAQEDGRLAAPPPGLAKRQEAHDEEDGGLLAAPSQSQAKRQDAGNDKDDDQLLAALSPGQQRQNERAAAQTEDGDHRGRGSPHDDVVFIPLGHGRDRPEDVGPHVPVDPLPEPTPFAAVPAALDAIL